MRLVLVLACLLGLGLGASLQRKPHHCKSPPLMSGAFTFASEKDRAWAICPYEYDAIEERIRIYEAGTFQNQSFTYDVLLLFREGVMYEIDDQSYKCVKRGLSGNFQPIEVPADASLLGSSVIGSSSGPGEGLLVNTWTGPAPDEGKYLLTMTEFGCIPVYNVFETEPFNWVIFSYINTVIGIVDPEALNPPPFCPGREVPPEGEPVDFFTVLKNMGKNTP